MKAKKLDPKLQAWVEARRHHLSHAHVQMARELGMNPKKLGKLDNHDQEPWKAPLPLFIEQLYFKSFGKTAPDEVLSIEQIAKRIRQKKEAQRAAKLVRRAAAAAQGASTIPVTGARSDPGRQADPQMASREGEEPRSP